MNENNFATNALAHMGLFENGHISQFKNALL